MYVITYMLGDDKTAGDFFPKSTHGRKTFKEEDLGTTSSGEADHLVEPVWSLGPLGHLGFSFGALENHYVAITVGMQIRYNHDLPALLGASEGIDSSKITVCTVLKDHCVIES